MDIIRKRMQSPQSDKGKDGGDQSESHEVHMILSNSDCEKEERATLESVEAQCDVFPLTKEKMTATSKIEPESVTASESLHKREGLCEMESKDISDKTASEQGLNCSNTAQKLAQREESVSGLRKPTNEPMNPPASYFSQC